MVEADQTGKDAVDFAAGDTSEETMELDALDAGGYGHLLGLNASEGGDERDARGPIEDWPAELDAVYTHMQKLGCGANSCAFLARRVEDEKVMVVKVNTNSLEVECGWMRSVRMQSCPDKKLRRLLETYVPTCDDVGTTSGGLWYLAQPMAGDVTFKDALKDGQHAFSDKVAKRIAAHLITAVYALHKVGYWHNDLNEKNIILDGDKPSLIDLGLASTKLCRTQRCRGSYSRDGNAIFRWLAVLAKCPREAQWDHSSWWRRADLEAQRVAQDRALECLAERWQPDAAFLAALGRVFDANAREALPEQHIQELYDTKFVKNNLPWGEILPEYRIKQTSHCQHWSDARLQEEMTAFGCVEPRDAVNGGLY